MSKSVGNVINPDDVVERWGADTLRLYEMFMGPFTDAIAWSTENMIGVRRFIERVWRLSEKVQDADVSELGPELHRTVKKVGEDIESFKFNTAVSQMMIFLNAAEKVGIGRAQWELFLKALAPFAPHMTEDLWRENHDTSIHVESWPAYDESKLHESTTVIVVQVNGKRRGQIIAPVDSDEKTVRNIIDNDLKLSASVQGKAEKQSFFVPNRLINFVLGD